MPSRTRPSRRCAPGRGQGCSAAHTVCRQATTALPEPTPQRTPHVTTASIPPHCQPPAPAAPRRRSIGLAAHASARKQPGASATAPAATATAGPRARCARGDRPAIARRARTADRTRPAGADAERERHRVASGGIGRHRRTSPAGGKNLLIEAHHQIDNGSDRRRARRLIAARPERAQNRLVELPGAVLLAMSLSGASRSSLRAVVGLASPLP